MRIYPLPCDKQTEIQAQLDLFEAQFRYPLGDNQTFSVSHGADYSAFYRSMGEAICLIAQSEETVFGTFCSTLRWLSRRDGNKPQLLAYLGDLKIDSKKQKTLLFYRMARQLYNLLYQRTTIAIGVVMDGTKNTPFHYSGKLEIPLFQSICQYTILRFNTEVNCLPYQNQNVSVLEEKEAFTVYQKITNHDYFLLSDSVMRSKITPQWLVENKQHACGKLEDTEKAKILFTSENQQLRSSHLSYFSFTNPAAGYDVLLHALKISKAYQFPHLFVALTPLEFNLLAPLLEGLSFDLSTATLFGNENALNLKLHLNTAEI